MTQPRNLIKEFNVDEIRKDFPILTRDVYPGVPLIYLDSTASSQKPIQVIETVERFYRHSYANIHRGIYAVAEEATAYYEEARKKIAKFIGANEPNEIIFTRNTTESINLVAQTWGRMFLREGDTIILTEMEHHSNLVPWQMLAAEKGVILRFIPVDESGFLDLEQYKKLLEFKPKLVAFAQMSNVLGTINPAQEIIELAHQVGAITLIDGAQSVPHYPVNVQDLDADFLAFSGHKMCGPSGIGVLYGKRFLLEAMPPYMGGGDMIKRVTLDSFSTNEIPYKFEAGTPAIAEAVGLGAAVDYLTNIGMDAIIAHEHEVGSYALERLVEIPGVKVYGPDYDKKGAVFSFTLEKVHAHDVSQILDHYGIAVRAGHHCAMPLHEKLGIPATTRASFYLYNKKDEVDQLVEGIYKAKEIFS